jgi:hypothetical protein
MPSSYRESGPKMSSVELNGLKNTKCLHYKGIFDDRYNFKYESLGNTNVTFVLNVLLKRFSFVLPHDLLNYVTCCSPVEILSSSLPFSIYEQCMLSPNPKCITQVYTECPVTIQLASPQIPLQYLQFHHLYHKISEMSTS